MGNTCRRKTINENSELTANENDFKIHEYLNTSIPFNEKQDNINTKKVTTEEIIKKIKLKNKSILLKSIEKNEFNSILQTIPNIEKIKEIKLELKKYKEKYYNKELINFPMMQFKIKNGISYIYQGTMDNEGNINGYGKLYIENIHSYYEGEFYLNVFNGKGLLINKKGDIYYGDWKNGEAFGEGEIKYASGDTFNGNFKNSFKDGKCKENLSNEDTFEGMYYQNNRNGMGVYKFNNGKDGFYYGNFYMGKMNDNLGFYQWKDGNNFKGCFKDNKIEGMGELKYNDNSFYKGTFTNFKKEGKGIFQFDNGDTINGIWVNNNLEGNAILEYNNKKYNLIFNNNNITKMIQENNIEDSFVSAMD